MIPKIIHYCWLSDDQIPGEFQQYINRWKTLLYDYRFIKWDFSRFDINTSAWVKEAFEQKKYAFAADYIRLFAVYHYGGIYLDMDIEVIKSFNDLLNNEYMFAAERPNEPWIEAGCFGAEKRNQFIKTCLERYTNKHFVNDNGDLDMLPLPKVMEIVRKENGVHLSLYPWTYFTAKSYKTGLIKKTEETYAIHHFAGSWKTNEEKEHEELVRKYSRIFGKRIGFNIVEYGKIAKEKGVVGIFQLTKEKIKRKTRYK